jgi:hypothetical protein
LIRGIVSTIVDLGGGNIVSEVVQGARVKIIERALEYLTDRRGEYVIYFKSLSDQDIIIEENAAALDDQKEFTKMGDDAKFDLVVNSSGFQEFRRSNIQVPNSKTTLINAKLLR